MKTEGASWRKSLEQTLITCSIYEAASPSQTDLDSWEEARFSTLPLDLKLVVFLWKSTKSCEDYTNSSHMACSARRSLLALNYSSVIPQGLWMKFYPYAVCIDFRRLLFMGVEKKKKHIFCCEVETVHSNWLRMGNNKMFSASEALYWVEYWLLSLTLIWLSLVLDPLLMLPFLYFFSPSCNTTVCVQIHKSPGIVWRPLKLHVSSLLRPYSQSWNCIFSFRGSWTFQQISCHFLVPRRFARWLFAHFWGEWLTWIRWMWWCLTCT